MTNISFIKKFLSELDINWTTLGNNDLVEIANSGRKPVKASLRKPGDSPYYGANNIQDYVEGYTHEGNYVLIAEDGSASLDEYSIQFTEGQFWANNHVHVLRGREGLDTRFLFHYLKSLNFKPFLSGGGRAKLTKGKLTSIPLPVIPIDKQIKISNMLDLFLDVTENLVLELENREKQYDYYRTLLLNFESDEEMEWKSLKEACDYVDYRGKTPKKTTEGVFLVTAKNIRMGYIDYKKSQEYISEEDYDSVMRRGIPEIGDVLITTEAPCGFVAQVDKDKIALAQRVIKYRSKDGALDHSFLKYYLMSSHFQKKLMQSASGSTVKGIKGSSLHKLTIPIPSIERQTEIVRKLDSFDTLTNSIAVGLPREIELRKKQYQYYVDLLLNWKNGE